MKRAYDPVAVATASVEYDRLMQQGISRTQINLRMIARKHQLTVYQLWNFRCERTRKQ